MLNKSIVNRNKRMENTHSAHVAGMSVFIHSNASMGCRQSTPSPSTIKSRSSDGLSNCGFYQTQHENAASKSSSSMTRSITIARARIRRRINRQRRGKCKQKLPVYMDVKTSGTGLRQKVARDIVGENILIFWNDICAWVECEVMEYGGVQGERRGLHRICFMDGLCEWKALNKFRIILSAKRYKRMVKIRKERGLKKESSEM